MKLQVLYFAEFYELFYSIFPVWVGWGGNVMGTFKFVLGQGELASEWDNLVGFDSPYPVAPVLIPVVSVRTEWNCRTPSWCQRVGEMALELCHLVPERH